MICLDTWRIWQIEQKKKIAPILMLKEKKVKGRKRKLYSASRYTLTSAGVIKE